tara:strand:+ start:1438 stop:2682 length:1245 start_codon:yes stop_codon:yes gene_type:complete
MKNLFDYRQKDYPYHFWLMQFIAFSYCILRLASRDYSIYGELPIEYFNYNRPYVSVYPSFILEILNTHFLYWFVDYPSSTTLYHTQRISMLIAILGLLGIFPRICALCLFLLLTHFTGFIQATNAELEGGTLLLVVLLILALSSSASFYCLFKRNNRNRCNENRWPVFLLFLFVGLFYTTSGLNKLIDVGPWWPFVLHLEKLAQVSIENSLFLTSRRVDALFCLGVLNAGYFWSVIAGLMTLVGELAFVSILFYPKYRLFLITNMFFLHYFVYLTAGINFLGSTFILLLCLDWNALFRKVTIIYDPGCSHKKKFAVLAKRYDWLDKLTFLSKDNPSSKNFLAQDETCDFLVIEESSGKKRGMDALDVLFHKIPVLWFFAFLSKIPILEALIIHLCIRLNKTFLSIVSHSTPKSY